MDWSKAACIGVTPKVFFPKMYSPYAMTNAKRVCSTCPIQKECIEDGLKMLKINPRADTGIRGGLPPHELLRLLRDSSEEYNLETMQSRQPYKRGTISERILSLLEKSPRPTDELAGIIGVSVQTIRKELRRLEAVGEAKFDDKSKPRIWMPAKPEGK